MAYGCVYGNVNFSFFLGFRAQKGKTDPINALRNILFPLQER